jgi:putative oxidoreductase
MSNRSAMMLGVLRIMTALQFIEHGSQKLFGFPTPTHGTAALLSLAGAAGCLEFFGGLLVLVGFQTRIAAFLLSGEMAIGYWMEHAPKSFFPALNGGDAAVLFCFVFLYLAFAGPGAWSLDGRGARA